MTRIAWNLILSLQNIEWHLSLPTAAKALQLLSACLRVTAAEAIQHLRVEKPSAHPNEMSAPATHVLLSALHDADPEVAFAVMQSPAEVNARRDERPATTEQDAQWMGCMRFWEEFQTSPT
jgi:hypothetical protein